MEIKNELDWRIRKNIKIIINKNWDRNGKWSFLRGQISGIRR
jgi:hypothetical protein